MVIFEEEEEAEEVVMVFEEEVEEVVMVFEEEVAMVLLRVDCDNKLLYLDMVIGWLWIIFASMTSVFSESLIFFSNETLPKRASVVMLELLERTSLSQLFTINLDDEINP